MSASSLAVEPAWRSVPDYASTLGPEVADLARLVNFGPDPEQEDALDAIFAKDRYGSAAAFEAAIIACRQNLKTALFEMAALGWLFLDDARLIVWSAHEFMTAQEAFRDMANLVESSAYLTRHLKAIHRANGDESIELMNDRRLIFKARTKGGGRGLSGDRVILDEAFALQPMHMGALLPTLSARPDPQVVYGSSAGLPESEVLRGVRDRGRAGKDGSLAYLEWCAPDPEQICADGRACTHSLESVGCGCDNPENWNYGNPALGRRITVEYIAKERRALPPHEFGRERMGWWDEPASGVAPISLDAWIGQTDLESSALDPVAIAFDVTPDRSAASIAIAGRRADGKSHVELIARQPGTGWLLAELVRLVEKWGPCATVMDTAGPAGAFEKDLIERGFEVEHNPEVATAKRLVLISGREYAQACSSLVDDVQNRSIYHRGDPRVLTAIEGARTRPLAEAYAWSRKNSNIDISPLVAVTLARHGFATYGVTEDPAPFAFWGE